MAERVLDGDVIVAVDLLGIADVLDVAASLVANTSDCAADHVPCVAM